MVQRIAPTVLILLCSGCGYLGTARSFDPAELDQDPGWISVRGLDPVRQETQEDCGAAALAPILAHWGLAIDRADIVRACPPVADRGIRAGDLRDFARGQGLTAYLFPGRPDDLKRELSEGRPVVVGLVKPYANGGMAHYELIAALHPEQGRVVSIDPSEGWRVNTMAGFLAEWNAADRVTLVILAPRWNATTMPLSTAKRTSAD